MINSAVLTGRLTKAPEIKTTQNGKAFCSFLLAVNRAAKKDGQPDADFINCIAWNKTAELMTQYLHKGSLIGVEGRIQTRNYENQQGQRVYITEIVADSIAFLESSSAANEQPLNDNVQNNANHGAKQPHQEQKQLNRSPYNQPNMNFAKADVDTFDIADDDLPF